MISSLPLLLYHPKLIPCADFHAVPLVFLLWYGRPVLKGGLAYVHEEAEVKKEGAGAGFDVVLVADYPGEQRRLCYSKKRKIEADAAVGLKH